MLNISNLSFPKKTKICGGKRAHRHIYIYAVKLKTGPRFGGFKVKNWSKLKVKNWSKFFSLFFPHFYSVFWIFLATQIGQQPVKIVFFLQNFGDVKNEVFEKKIAFFVFVFFMLEKYKQKKEKQTKWKKPKNPIKIGFFKVVIQKCEKSKKMDF